MYESPIKIIDDIVSQVKMELEGNILKAVRRVNVDVDEEELLKALQYDREQYKRGYEDGKRDAVVLGWWEGIRCSECGQVDWTKPNFCPNCGADMRGWEENA